MEQKKRPVFLTVLCILSYIGLGWGMFSSLINLIASQFLSSFSPFFHKLVEYTKRPSRFPGGGKVEEMFDFIQNIIDNAFTMNLAALFLSLLALFGVLMMWRLKMAGFYLYLGAKIFIVSIPIMFLGMNGIVVFLTAINGFIAGIFIILYALNIRHLE